MSGEGERTEIVVDAPVVDAGAVVVRWRVAPDDGLCRPSELRLHVPDGVDLSTVPERLLWTIALLCLHPQWALQRPCRVVLPVALGAGVAETWLRLVDAVVVTHDRTAARHAELEGRPWGPVPERGVEIVELGDELPDVDADRWFGVGSPVRAATAFSGGKDGLLQLALADELGLDPVAVTVTSPLPGRYDQTSARRREVLATIGDRLPVQLVEVRTGLRAALDGDRPARLGWHISLTEMIDTHLYLAATLLVGWASRRRLALVASEAEVQATIEVDGRIVQHPHLMYSAATQLALDALVRPLGMAVGSLTYPLPSGQVQRLLWTRYPGVRDLQYSCWRVQPDEAACSACSQCLRVAMGALAAGGDPAEMGIDLPRLLDAQAGWRPGSRPATGLPDDEVRASLHGQVVRSFAEVTPADLVARTGLRRTSAAARAYRRLRRAVLAAGPVPPPQGYRPDALDLVPEPARAGLEAVFAASLAPADPTSSAGSLERTRRLLAWTTEPLELDRTCSNPMS